ncbi:hypothetical protein Tco_1197364 [Tanacetum coccineum]
MSDPRIGSSFGFGVLHLGYTPFSELFVLVFPVRLALGFFILATLCFHPHTRDQFIYNQLLIKVTPEDLPVLHSDVEELKKLAKKMEVSLTPKEHKNNELKEQVRKFEARWGLTTVSDVALLKFKAGLETIARDFETGMKLWVFRLGMSGLLKKETAEAYGWLLRV